MFFRDLLFALLLPLPPWVGFQLFKRKGRVGLSYGYFLGGIVCILAVPWADLTGRMAPTAQLGGSLLGFTLFLQALREGAQGLRRLLVGLGGATLFLLLMVSLLHLSYQSVALFWGVALMEGLLWLLLSDLAFHLAKGRWLQARMPLVGAASMGLAALAIHYTPTTEPHAHPAAAVTGGVLLGLVALEQLLWLRQKGSWVEGRGEGLRLALTVLDENAALAAPSLGLELEAKQPLVLINEKGLLLEANGPFSARVGLPRHALRGYAVDSLLQGDGKPVWEDLKDQLVRHGFARLRATLVNRDGAFESVSLEAVGFDLNLALAWISEAEAGTLAVRGEVGAAVLSGGLDAAGAQALVNALGAIIPAADQIIAESGEEPVREMGRVVMKAAQRLRPLATGGELSGGTVDAVLTMEAIQGFLQRMLPSEVAFRHRTSPMVLAVPQEDFQRVAAHLVLQGREAVRRGSVALVVEPVAIGGRPWALWRVEADGELHAPPQEILGLAWLLQTVRQAHGMLECSRDATGLWPKVYLPVDAPPVPAPPRPLTDRVLWIVDRDPLVRETLTVLARQEGGHAESFASLRELLKRSRVAGPPSLLIMERQPQLDRFQGALRRLSREPIPALVLGSGQALPLDPAAFGIHQVGFLDKPFASQDFVQSLLALLRARSSSVGS